ncbi:MAG: nucleotide exchange factor GrpE [Clostridia bacterium]|nr:nucleotide exchange factor GrpE [Clostridia bacterium]
MTDEIKNEELVAEEIPAEQEAAAAPEKESKKKTKKLEAQIDELSAKLEAAADELAAANDKYLRLAAEYDNFRKRSAKEREGIYGDAYADALCALLPIFDNLERAVKYADGENLQQGVALTLKGLATTLEKLGITEIEAEGKPFDPNFHNAVMHVEDETLGEGVVAEVLQKGYCRGERVLRYAMVKVAN